ncbi:unnamed protein product [Phytophthora fragariaefolia]|uniref:Unnamed protein product n=1 Tax=Phytophthora fragariaefolia TaxID=1490495 RepID=A0A9W6U1T8_9STRA|nr:unnamed protein product [Phytophthora fragariaefolia]
MGGVTEPVYVTADALINDMDGGNNDEFEYEGNEIHFEDYAHELAFLPDLTVPASTILDYDAPNVKTRTLDPIAQLKLVETLRRHEEIMIASGNALPPTACGVVCDIDVRGHAPIKQRARPIPLKYLRRLYDLLKGLLEAGLIAFSSSPWASPIVIVLKKNGQDIRLCIDYKMVNAITLIMEYAMPLVDDLLTEMKSYLWFCSLDPASGFWAIMMTMRARWVSAFVCAHGPFEWLRMPFGLKKAPMTYQRMIDNALWGYVEPKGGWEAFAQRMKDAEAKTLALRKKYGYIAKIADLGSASTTDQINQCWSRCSIGDHSSTTSVSVGLRSTTLARLARFAECRISVSFTKSVFVQHKVAFLSHEVTNDGIRANSKKLAAIAELPFPSSKKGMQSFLGALNYYGRFIQGLAVYGAVLYQLKDEGFAPGGDLSVAREAFTALQRKVAEAPILRHFDGSKDVYTMLYANEWARSSTVMQMHDEVLHRVRFCGRFLKENELNYHPAEKLEVLALLQVLKVCYTLLAGKTLHGYTQFSTLEWVFQSKSLFGRSLQFAVFLSQWYLKIKHVRERHIEFAKVLQSSITPFVSLDEAVTPLAPPSKGSATVRMDQHLLYASITRDYDGYALSFDGSAKTEKHGGHGSWSWILWKLPAWDLVTATSAHLPSTTVNIAEKTELKALNKIPEVLYVDEQALTEPDLPAQRMQPIPQTETHAVSQTLEEPQVTAAVNEVDDLPADQGSPISAQGGAQRSAREGAHNLETTLDEPTRADPKEASEREDPTTVQAERIRRLRVAQNEERRWADLKAYHKGDVESLSFKRAANASKLAGRFVLDEDGLLQYVGKGRKLDEVGEQEPQLRLVIPTTMIDEVLQSCHDSIERLLLGRPVRHSNTARPRLRRLQHQQRETSLIGLFAGQCARRATLPAAIYGFCDTPAKASTREHIAAAVPVFVYGLRDRQGHGSTKAQDVAEVFEEYVFRRFGAPTMIRHDRDPRFMSETFKAFAELIEARIRATLSYRPQANGQQERSVKCIVQRVNVYVEDPLQQDWNDIAEKMAHAINNAMDTMRKETPFYLVHGWDAHSTLKAMTSSLRLGDGSLTDAAAWRREANRQHEVAFAMAKPYQATEKARRAKEHNEASGRQERMAVPVDERIDPTEVGYLASDPTYRPLFKPGSRVWLFMDRVKPDLTKKVAHRWHGPFRIKRKVEEFAYELELPDKAGYQIYPVVHVSRIKPVRDDNRRPIAELVDGLGEDDDLTSTRSCCPKTAGN